MKKLATIYGCQKFINRVKVFGYAVTHRTCADIHLMYVKYTDKDSYTKDEGASANPENKWGVGGCEGIAALVLSIDSSIEARQL
jgi:hypothetical protein